MIISDSQQKYVVLKAMRRSNGITKNLLMKKLKSKVYVSFRISLYKGISYRFYSFVPININSVLISIIFQNSKACRTIDKYGGSGAKHVFAQLVLLWLFKKDLTRAIQSIIKACINYQVAIYLW